MAQLNGLPRATFAKLSPHEYLLTTLDAPSPSRVNGRAPAETRPWHVNTSSLTHAHGSALVRAGDTTVICGVRGETLPTSAIPNYRASNRATELHDYDLLVPNIELATGSAPQFLPGVPPTTLAQTLSTRVYSLLRDANLVDPQDLRIWYTPAAEDDENARAADDGERMEQDDEEEPSQEGEKVVMAYWVLYIDIFFISYDGNPFDVAWAALVAALRDTKLPQAYWDPDRETVLCKRDSERPLTITGLPVASTAAVFAGRDRERRPGDKYWILLDPDRVEENVCDETFTITVDRSRGETKLLGLAKHGGTVVSLKQLAEHVRLAEMRWQELRDAMT